MRSTVQPNLWDPRYDRTHGRPSDTATMVATVRMQHQLSLSYARETQLNAMIEHGTIGNSTRNSNFGCQVGCGLGYMYLSMSVQWRQTYKGLAYCCRFSSYGIA